MKRTYTVLCRTCGGEGWIKEPYKGTTSVNEIICPVCQGSKVQEITEED